MIALLKRPGGATLKAIMSVTGWQSHSVREFVSAHLTKRKGFKVKSFRRVGERVCQLTHKTMICRVEAPSFEQIFDPDEPLHLSIIPCYLHARFHRTPKL